MLASRSKRTIFAIAASVAALTMAMAGCSSGGSSASGKVHLTFLTSNNPNTIKAADALVKAFETANPNITIKTQPAPSGAGEDSLIKTKLATGTMDDIFAYNTGAALSALSPEKTLVDIAGDPALKDVLPTFLSTVSVGKHVYGVPIGTAMGGGILYNKKVYADLGLKIPLTWDEFMANSAKIKAAGKTAVIATYADPWTAQLLVLSNFYNVQAAQPNFVADYTANKTHYADDPIAQVGFDHLQTVFKSGFLNSDFASAKFDDGIKLLATGAGVQYPMLTFALASVESNYPANVKDIGFFATPGSDPAVNGMTTWMPKAIYISSQVKDPNKLAAAKKFLSFVATTNGCDLQTKAVGATGPYLVKGCTLGSNVPPAVEDMLPYVQKGDTSPALEFLTPLAGPNLDVISVAVGSGVTSPSAGAAQYDGEIKKQAQQLGLKGW